MNKILIDIGNSENCKVAFSVDMEIKSVYRVQRSELLCSVDNIVASCGHADVICMSSVRMEDEAMEMELGKRAGKLIKVSSYIPLPITIDYDTPQTLGADRIAAIVGAKELFPDEDCIVFDFGTAITIDFLSSEGIFYGGNISLGKKMRFNAVNSFTEKLPLVEGCEPQKPEGKNTVEAINNGVILGIIFEVQKYIEKYPTHKVVFTGGDAVFFAKMLKSPIFVACNLVLIGLSKIAQFND